MDSPSNTPQAPGPAATASLGSFPTPTADRRDSTTTPDRLDPCEYDLSDWHAPPYDRAPAPSALLESARDFVEAYRAATWLFDSWDAPRRAIAVRFAAAAAAAWRTGLTSPGVDASMDVLRQLQGTDAAPAQLAAAAAQADRAIADANFGARQARSCPIHVPSSI